MSNWDLMDYKYNTPYFQHDYGAQHGSASLHYGYQTLPSYAKDPMRGFEQQYRNEQQDKPSHISCSCGAYISIPAITEEAHIACTRCHKDYGRFVGSNVGNAASDNLNKITKKEILKEGLDLSMVNLNSISENNLCIILFFVFIIFICCLYTHISAIKAELKNVRKTIINGRM